MSKSTESNLKAATGIGYSGIGLTVVGVISIVKGREELIDCNLTDAVTDIVDGIKKYE